MIFSGCRNDRHWISVLGRLLLPLRGGCTQPHPLHLPTWNALPKWQWNLQGLWHCFIILFSIKVNDCLLLFSLTIYLLHQQECSSGTYTNHTGASTCDTCPDGFYCLPVQPDNATLNAQPCPEGYYCPAGTVSPNNLAITHFDRILLLRPLYYFSPTVWFVKVWSVFDYEMHDVFQVQE